MSTVLTSAQTRFLRGQAHDLKALLQIGAKGLTPSFIAELDGGTQAWTASGRPLADIAES